MEFIDYYAALGVDPSTDDKAIKTAYRKLARKYHPDVSKLPGTEEKFKQVAEAYEVLHNSEKRAEYDELRLARSRGHNPNSQQSGTRYNSSNGFSGFNEGGTAGGDEDFAAFFNSMFGAAGSHTSQSRGRQGGHQPHADNNQHRGRDLEMEWPVMLEDTLADTVKPIEFVIPHYNLQGQLHEIKKTLNVKIPAGVSDGERIRLKGQGAPSHQTGHHGDLYLHIRLVPHPLFDIEGHNLLLTLPLAPWEAALGAKIVVPTLSGKIQLSIPPNSQSGQRMRIKGKGLIGKQGAGDLFVAIKIVMPHTATATTQQLWSQLADAARFDPRTEWSN